MKQGTLFDLLLLCRTVRILCTVRTTLAKRREENTYDRVFVALFSFHFLLVFFKEMKKKKEAIHHEWRLGNGRLPRNQTSPPTRYVHDLGVKVGACPSIGPYVHSAAFRSVPFSSSFLVLLGFWAIGHDQNEERKEGGGAGGARWGLCTWTRLSLPFFSFSHVPSSLFS